MNTLSWLEILLFSLVFVGTICYHVGAAMGREEQKNDVAQRQAAMRRHPSYSLRVKQWEEEKE